MSFVAVASRSSSQRGRVWPPGERLPHRAESHHDCPRPVNLILFEHGEIDRPLLRSDRRAVHLLEVLRRRVGDTFDVGVINGPRGKATLASVSDAALSFKFTPSGDLSEIAAITLLIGLPRPQTARDILRDATTLGVAAMHFVATEKGQASYGQSPLWSTGEWRRHVVAGAEQAFDPRLPDVSWGRPLTEAWALGKGADVRIALDNYESPTVLSAAPIMPGQRVVLAIGGERGWAAGERAALRAHGFQLCHLGVRVLRVETACTVAVALVRAKLGLM
jgi:16S rRNA (uracil1498-N3)-methyltransferase